MTTKVNSQVDNMNKHILSLNDYISCKDFNSKMKLRFVKIYFYATTFDRITKDRAAKFVDMLSAIGGTMGLLTGFSIISGVEIVYFSVKFILQSVKKLKEEIQ